MRAVYFAQVGDYIKVGCSRDPERRVQRLFSSETRYCRPEDCPTDAASRRLLATIPGWTNVEAACHSALDDFRVVGEFFLDEPPVREFIARALTGDLSPVVRADGPYVDPNRNRHLTPEFRASVDSFFNPTPEQVERHRLMIERARSQGRAA